VPKDLPPRSTLFDYLDMWSYDGTLDRIHHALYVGCREKGEREASPTAAIIDSQSVKSAEKGACIDPHGYNAGKKIKGKKRQVLVDTLGLLLHAIVHPADIRIATRHPASCDLVRNVSVLKEALCRCWLPGTAIPEGTREDPSPPRS
jgi:hypothetical protein